MGFLRSAGAPGAGGADDRDAMLLEIREEVAGTSGQIGKEALDERVMAAMARVPREMFVPESRRLYAFANGPVPIGHGQTISQPYMVALMSDLLRSRPDSVILEIGTGSGYQAAVLAEIVDRVYSVEIIDALAESAAARLAALGYHNVMVKRADGYQGWAEFSPFDGIVVTAAAPHIPPPLVDQLKPGARLVIPVGDSGRIQELKVVEKQADGSVGISNVIMVAFVPLTGALR